MSAQVRAGAAPLPVEFGLTASQPGAVGGGRPGAHPQPRHQQQRRVRGAARAGGGGGRRSRPTACAASSTRRTRCASPRGSTRPTSPPTSWPTTCWRPRRSASRRRAPRRRAPARLPSWPRPPPRRAPTTGRSRRRAPPPAAPILASDPHRVLVAPSIRYIVHLDAPGLQVMGAGELHLPGVTIGHNDRVAFGITIFMADQADLYVYELNPENPRQYRYGDGWEDMRIVTRDGGGEGRGAARGGAGLHPPRPGAEARPGSRPRLRPAHRSGSSRARRPTSPPRATRPPATGRRSRRR